MGVRGIIVATIALALGGCATPLVTPNPPEMQSKATHAVNWQQLSERAVAAMPWSPAAGEKFPVYVDAGPDDTEFARAFKSFMEEQLLKANYPVASTRADPKAIVVTFETQSLLYDHGSAKPITGYASLYTTAAAILGQTRNISSVDTGLAAGLVAGPVIDVLAAIGDTTDAEVILTTKVDDGSHVHFLRTETFYVRPVDLKLYVPPEQTLPVVQLPVNFRRGG